MDGRPSGPSCLGVACIGQKKWLRNCLFWGGGPFFLSGGLHKWYPHWSVVYLINVNGFIYVCGKASDSRSKSDFHYLAYTSGCCVCHAGRCIPMAPAGCPGRRTGGDAWAGPPIKYPRLMLASSLLPAMHFVSFIKCAHLWFQA